MRLQRAKFGVFLLSGAAVLAGPLPAARAQVSYTSTTGGSYQQSFDTLLSSGSAPEFRSNSPTDTTDGLKGWYAYRSGTGTSILANNGGSGTASLHSFGFTDASDRALGSIGGADPGNFVWAVQIRNDTGLTITGFTLQYTGEQWRYSGSAVVQKVDFSYGVFDQSNSLASATLLNPTASGFTNVDTMDFFSPVSSGTGGGARNGNDPANRRVLSAAIDAAILPGQDLVVRWYDPDHPLNNDHGLATDDFVFTATQFQPVPAPPAAVSLGLGGLVGLAGVALRRLRSRKRKRSREYK